MIMFGRLKDWRRVDTRFDRCPLTKAGLSVVLIKTRHPSRFTLSKWRGLTPARNQSGDRDISGGITKAGDVTLRRALCRAAPVMMHEEGQKTVRRTVFPTTGGRSTWLRPWAVQMARRRGAEGAMIALARRISVILHPIATDGTTFRSEIEGPHAR
ncbi:MAG: hypothetical protein ABS73_14785 [Paracoccus sp. SCN 68-21]|nr:MAG: hypothetical protein ABS73_14785 [Paracoccus sp. SCN 68-21]